MKNEKNKDRRSFLKEFLVLGAIGFLSPQLMVGCINRLKAENNKADPFDETLEAMAHIGLPGNHGPMAAEAIAYLGFENHLPVFLENFLRTFSSSFPAKKKEILNENWKKSIGDPSRATDWITFFNREINERNWLFKLNEWTLRLSPGLSGAATHGLIRTGHAVRSLGNKYSPVRKNELAQALGYWASFYREFSKSINRDELKLNPKEAIKKIPILPDEKLLIKGNIMRELQNLENFPDFNPVIDFIKTDQDANRFLSELIENLTEIFIERVNRKNVLKLIHSITSLSAIKNLIPYISKETAAQLCLFGWQSAAALVSISGNNINKRRKNDPILNPDELKKKAVFSNEVHIIKFTEACLKEYRIKPEKKYLVAANTALNLLS